MVPWGSANAIKVSNTLKTRTRELSEYSSRNIMWFHSPYSQIIKTPELNWVVSPLNVETLRKQREKKNQFKQITLSVNPFLGGIGVPVNRTSSAHVQI